MPKRIVPRRHGDVRARVNKQAPLYAKRLTVFVAIGAVAVLGCLYFNDIDPFSPSGQDAGLRRGTKVCSGDSILPIFPYEDTWQVWIRALLYLIFLGFLFLGVAISADTFMAAIEVITSKTTSVNIGGEDVEVEIWNATVANLTLMALGSSAPEILLAVVEVCALKFEAGDLGPGTIVGSAAFNLLFITAICISSLPEVEDDEGNVNPDMLETREIEEFGVFVITAIASLFAYLWMVIVLAFISKDRVDLFEALLTLVFFPILVWVSWAQDSGWWGWFGADKVAPDENEGEIKSITGEDGKKRRRTTVHRDAAAALEASDLKDADPEAAVAAAKKAAQDALKKKKKSRLEYRIQATRKMTGGKRIMPSTKADKLDAVPEEAVEAVPEGILVGFENPKEECSEACGTKVIKVVRSGVTDKYCAVQFDTSDGDANSKDDYITATGTLEFQPGDTEKEITITIIDDNEWAPDKHFYVRLYGAKTADEAAADTPKTDITLTTATVEVTILNDDDPGTVEFDNKTFTATDSSKCLIPLKRKDGYDGNVLVFLKSIDGTAEAGKHYVALPDEYEVHFEHDVRMASVPIELLNMDTNVTFTLEITSLEPEGAKLGDNNKCTVIISKDENYQKLMMDVANMMDAEVEKYSVGTSSWSEQFHDAMNMGGDDGEDPEMADYILHCLSFYWKVIHAFIPPTDYGGGWYTFWISLGYIGAITAFVGDAAKILGCCIGLDDGITAITFVALGTSLPDTFASMEATVSDDTADAAITNVTGSNSVNVFLGLGLPWTMAVIYHIANGSDFNYPAADLNYSVIVFFIFALICLVLLYVRRVFCGGELGGNKMAAYGSSAFLATSWLAYVVLSAMRTKGHV